MIKSHGGQGQLLVKIALVSPYDFVYPGGVALHISALDYHFTKMGHEVKVIAPASKTVSSFGDRFIPIGRPRPIPTSGSIARVTISPWLSSRIKAVLSQENFDIIHLHEPLMPMLCTTVLRLSQTANIGTFHACHGRPGYNFAKPFGKWILKRWFRKLDGKIAVSKPAREFAYEHFSGYYNIIPNGVNLDHFSPAVPPIDEFCDGKLNILFVGRLEKRKGLNYLIEAFKQVKQEISNSRLIIVGPGTRLRHRYEKQIMRSGLKDVIFVGFVSYDELPRYYKTADVFCAPATGRESFGIVLLEAMAVGKPIVASNIEGYAGVVTHGVDGLLVPPQDTKMLAQALISLLTDQALRQQMGARGKAKASEYSWEQIAQKVLNYYVRVLSEPPWKKRFLESEAKAGVV
ncbi:MAG: glycosyltransferase family 4 protein [Dehalococcoidia bacterium]|nr:glycosyltransferase family 4 protein [Dehalococcoidia bacterium]